MSGISFRSSGMKVSRAGALTAMAMAAFFISFGVGAQMKHQMKKPPMVTLSGKLIDMTCSAKGKALMNSWGNAESNTHMTPDGKKANCAKMCLLGGQPAGLFDAKSGKISAVFACNPRATLANFAAKDVEVMGFWAGSKQDAARSFFPAKIRSAGSGSWTPVDCATMHG